MLTASTLFECELSITSKRDFTFHSLNSLRPKVLNALKDPEEFLKKHASRQEEFIMTRCQAAELYKTLTQKNCFYYPSLQDRSPVFPSDVVGSFSHSQDHVSTAMALQSHMRSVGIDIETLGRFKPKMSEVIQNNRDLKSSDFLSDDQLGTLIFSAKESFFKLLYPLVRKYFYFSDAAIVDISLSSQILSDINGHRISKWGEFKVELLSELTKEMSPQSQLLFQGKWVLFDSFLLTVMELKYK